MFAIFNALIALILYSALVSAGNSTSLIPPFNQTLSDYTNSQTLGIIKPDAADPIVLERTNDGATSSYTFYMSLSTRLPACKNKTTVSF